MTAVVAGPLSARQERTRQKLVESARTLLSRQSDFTVRDVAREAGLSAATAYTYFGSRDQLLAEIYQGFVDELTARLRARPPTGTTPLERVRSVIRRATVGVERSRQLAGAFTDAMASSDPAVRHIGPRLDDAFRTWIDLAIGDAPVADREVVTRTLELTFYGAMISMGHGRLTAAGVRRTVDDAARLLLTTTEERA